MFFNTHIIHLLTTVISIILLTIACTTNQTSPTKDNHPPKGNHSSESHSSKKDAKSFVLENYEILASKEGDLNGDGYKDVVMILKANNEADLSNYAADSPALRPMIILTRDNKGNLTEAARNDKAVLCIDCGGQMGDPFVALEINKQGIYIEHYGGTTERWSNSVTFAFDSDKSTWVLALEKTELINSDHPEKTEEINNSKKIKFNDFNIYE